MIMFATEATVSNISYIFSPLLEVAHGKLRGSTGRLVARLSLNEASDELRLTVLQKPLHEWGGGIASDCITDQQFGTHTVIELYLTVQL
jgi:hypothetical protein